MLKVVNKLLEEQRGSSELQIYEDFAKEQVERINAQNVQWLSRQSFSETAPEIQFTEMKIEGEAHEESSDKRDSIKWELRFDKPLRDGISSSWLDKSLANGLLHIGSKGRLPEVAQHNSAPQLFSTADYMQIGVSNGVAGWVKYGEFPRGVRTENFIKDYGMSIPTKLESETIPIFTDVRRDAEAGFGAAGEWAKFRTMAVACSDFVLGSLKKEDKSFRDMPRESQEERNVKYNANELLRSRIEFVAPLMISLLPNTMLRNGQGTLRGYYKPGVLEGALALELEKGVNPNFGRTDEPRPISGIDGAPIDISPTGRKGEYDALLRFRLHVYMPGLENNETAREVVQSNLEKYFNVGVHDSSNIFFTMHIPKANRVYQELLQGANDTIIHKQSAAIIDAVREVSSSAKYWKDMQMPVLEQGYKAMVKAGISEHFGRLEQAFNRRQSIQRL